MIERTELQHHADPPTYGWDWAKFQGGAKCLRWNRRDIEALDLVVDRVPKKRVVVQAGGNLGMFPKRLAQTFDAVYTFEPHAANFAALCQNAPESNIVKFQAALGCTQALVGTSVQRQAGRLRDHEGLSHIDGAGIVPTMRLDDLGLPVCDLIYLDIQGWESYALTGAVETIRRCRPAIAVEVAFTADELRDQVIGYGYEMVMRVLSDEVFLPVAA